jgi:hypothetical protein
VLDRVFREVQEIAAIEQVPLMEGRRMIMVLAPKVGVVRQASSGGVGATSSLAGSPVTGPATSPVSGSAGGQAGGQAGSPAGGPAAGTAGDRPGAVPGV